MGDQLREELPVELPVEWKTTELTHYIGFTSYVEVTLLGVCLLICLYAAGRKPSAGLAACCGGFLLLILKFVCGMLLVFAENPSLALSLSVEWLGPIGLALLAAGLWLQAPAAQPADGDAQEV